MPASTARRVVQKAAWATGGVLGLVAAATAGYVYRNLTSFGLDMAAVRRSGVTEKSCEIGGVSLNYAEGPDCGPALLLIHGQSTDWKNYARALPRLAEHFHVYAVDCLGHGGSTSWPPAYSVNAHGSILAEFIEQVIGAPSIVSGHSSGGHLAAWLAANHAPHVRAVVLEDPPWFTTSLPRARMTWNYVDLATNAHRFLTTQDSDFVTYQVQHTRVWSFFGNGKDWFINQGLRYRTRHPDAPVRWWSMPPIMNESFRGLQRYDPRFGDAFFTGTWDEGFDHAATLARITVPTVLVHTNWAYDDTGILMGAMDGDDAARARSLIPDVEFTKVDSGHGFHWEKPDEFTTILLHTKQRIEVWAQAGRIGGCGRPATRSVNLASTGRLVSAAARRSHRGPCLRRQRRHRG